MNDLHGLGRTRGSFCEKVPPYKVVQIRKTCVWKKLIVLDAER